MPDPIRSGRSGQLKHRSMSLSPALAPDLTPASIHLSYIPNQSFRPKTHSQGRCINKARSVWHTHINTHLQTQPRFMRLLAVTQMEHLIQTNKQINPPRLVPTETKVHIWDFWETRALLFWTKHSLPLFIFKNPFNTSEKCISLIFFKYLEEELKQEFQ